MFLIEIYIYVLADVMIIRYSKTVGMTDHSLPNLHRGKQ